MFSCNFTQCKNVLYFEVATRRRVVNGRDAFCVFTRIFGSKRLGGRKKKTSSLDDPHDSR